jgi:hypothetical protein
VSKPPDDVAPSELFRTLIEMPRPSEVVDFPRNDAAGKPIAQIRVQILTSDEHDKAREDAHKKLKARGISNDDMSAPAVREVLGDAIAKELIAMACLTAKNQSGDDNRPMYGREFRNGADVGKLGADEILVLFNTYHLVQHKYGPIERNLSEADIDAWIVRLQEGAAEFPLLNLALPQLVLLAQSLAQRHYTLCSIMASQLKSLPDTLAALLAPFLTGIISVGSLADETDPDGLGRRDRPLGPISTEAAAEMAAKMRDR